MKKISLTKKIYQVGKYQINALVSEKTVFATKPSIILVHGIASGFYMSPVAKYLASCFNVYVLDFPGFGDSSKPKNTLSIKEHANFLAKFIEKQNFKKPILLGNSYGCQIIIHFAKTYPDKLSKAILTGPTVDKNARNLFAQAKALFLNTFKEPKWQNEKAIKSEFPKAGIKRLFQTVLDSIKDKPEFYLSKINIPCLVVRGGIDPFVSRKWAMEVVNLLPKGEFEEIPNKGHTVNSNSPKRLADIVNRFI